MKQAKYYVIDWTSGNMRLSHSLAQMKHDNLEEESQSDIQNKNYFLKLLCSIEHISLFSLSLVWES
jgi:hypothetical protein